MEVIDQQAIERIRRILRGSPRGMTISTLSRRMKTNRNLVAKYLDLMLISGQVRVDRIGTAKVFSLQPRVPLQGLLELSTGMVIVMDMDRKILHVNESVLRFTGATREMLVGKHCGETGIQSFCDIPVSSADIEQSYEVSMVVEGERHHFRARQLPAVFEDGTRGIIMIMDDITAQMKSRLMLEMREATYHRVVEDQVEFVCRLTPDLRIAFASLSLGSYLQLPRERILDTRLTEYLRDNGRIVRDTIRSLAPERCIASCEAEMVGGGGSGTSVLWTFYGLFDPSGELLEVLGIGRDMGKERAELEERCRKFSERLRRECEERFRLLGEAVTHGMYRATADPRGKFVWSNDAFMSLLGFRSALELKGIDVIELFIDPGMRMDLLEELRRQGMVKGRMLELKRKDGTPLRIAVTAVAEFDPEGRMRFINGVVQEVSEGA